MAPTLSYMEAHHHGQPLVPASRTDALFCISSQVPSKLKRLLCLTPTVGRGSCTPETATADGSPEHPTGTCERPASSSRGPAILHGSNQPVLVVSGPVCHSWDLFSFARCSVQARRPGAFDIQRKKEKKTLDRLRIGFSAPCCLRRLLLKGRWRGEPKRRHGLKAAAVNWTTTSSLGQSFSVPLKGRQVSASVFLLLWA